MINVWGWGGGMGLSISDSKSMNCIARKCWQWLFPLPVCYTRGYPTICLHLPHAHWHWCSFPPHLLCLLEDELWHQSFPDFPDYLPNTQPFFLWCRFIVSSRGSLGLPWQASRAISWTICSAPLLLAVLLTSLSSSTGWPQPMWWMMWTPGSPLMWTWPSSARYMYSCIW